MEAKELITTFNEQHPNGSVEDLTKFINTEAKRRHKVEKDKETERLHKFLSGLKDKYFVVYNRTWDTFRLLHVVEPLIDTKLNSMECKKTIAQGLNTDQFNVTRTQLNASVLWYTIIADSEDFPIFREEDYVFFEDNAVTEISETVYYNLIADIDEKRKEILAISSIPSLEQFKK